MSTNGYRSMTRAAYHLREAANSLAVVAGHLASAREADPDPEKSTEVYLAVLQNLNKICEGLKLSRQPDLDREAKGVS